MPSPSRAWLFWRMLMFNKVKSSIAVFALVAGLALNAHAAEVTGAGASFVYPAMSKWSSDYNKATKNKINYQSIGSGGGIAQIKAATVDFGSSDAPLKAGDLSANNLVQFPSVMGAVVPVVNLPGVKPGSVKLTGPILADIYLGKITKWNDPAIAALNAAINTATAALAKAGALAALGIEPVTESAAQFRAFIANDVKDGAELLKDAGFKPE